MRSRDELLAKYKVEVDGDGNLIYVGAKLARNEITNEVVLAMIDLAKGTKNDQLTTKIAVQATILISQIMQNTVVIRPDATLCSALQRFRKARAMAAKNRKLADFEKALYSIEDLFCADGIHQFPAQGENGNACELADLDESNMQIANLTVSLNSVNLEAHKKDAEISKLCAKLEKARAEKTRVFDAYRQMKARRKRQVSSTSVREANLIARLKTAEKALKRYASELERTKLHNKKMREKISIYVNTLKEYDMINAELKDTIESLQNCSVLTKEGNKYSPSVRKVIWKLKAAKVSDSIIGEIFGVFASFFKVELPSTPSRRSIGRTVIAGAAICSEQMKEIICHAKNVVHGSDETTKDGHKLLMQTITYCDIDDDGKVMRKEYILSMDEIADKSADTQLEVLLACLDRLGDDPLSKKKIGDIFLEQVEGTISDAAATQKKLNRLIENVKKDRLVQLGEKEKSLLVDLCISTCQVHAVNNMVTPILETFSDFERSEGLQSTRGSVALRIANEGSKLLGQRGASINHKMDYIAFVAKNDVTGLSKHVTPTVPSLLGHRFMVYCFINEKLFLYKDLITQFVEMYGTGNEQLQDLVKLMNSMVGKMEMFVLCAVFQKILMPLWGAIVHAQHILNTKEYVTEVLDYIAQCYSDKEKLFDCSACLKHCTFAIIGNGSVRITSRNYICSNYIRNYAV